MNDDLEHRIRKALIKEDDSALEEYADEIWDIVLDEGEVPPDLFVLLRRLLRDTDLHEAPRSRYVFQTVGYVWAELDEQQKMHLLPVLEDAFPKLADWHACLAITDILGARSGNTEALGVLTRLNDRLQAQDRQVPRSLLANGFRLLVLAEKQDVALEAYKRLEELTNDRAEVVQAEARAALRHLGAALADMPTHPLRDTVQARVEATNSPSQEDQQPWSGRRGGTSS